MKLSLALRLSSVSVAVAASMMATSVSAQSLEDRIHQLESQIGQMETVAGQGAGGSVELYGSLRPKLNYTNTDPATGSDNSTTDVQDALSRVGIRAKTDIGNGWHAAARGEWQVAIDGDGSFGLPRLAYVELGNESFGTVAYGRQWTAFYNTVGELTDIANHRASPFGYDAIASFRVDNLVTYRNDFGPLNIQLDTQFDGKGEGDSEAANSDGLDRYTIAAGLNLGALRLGAAYEERVIAGADNNELIGLAASYKVGDLYLAATWVDRDSGNSSDQTSVDLAASYGLGNGLTVQSVISDVDDSNNANDTDSYYFAVQKQLNDQVRVWTDLRFSEVGRTASTDVVEASIGLRYDFSLSL
ncbi:porin [Pelagibaculum spongiae]|uniref:Porin domain-containing protein n=1 Tax=Pelagibaculum spongiae TaxID=2080658 RepID=A0A2V1H1Y1_9GAMM|nr:porin [Pelagibaculum spongiae]PVZ72543.1 hypothetical protein DC094_05975 [Pelagibaculum spongiae]